MKAKADADVAAATAAVAAALQDEDDSIHGVTRAAAEKAVHAQNAVIISVLTPGAEGHVFVAKYPGHEREVVLKVGPSSLCIAEATLLRTLENRHIIRLQDVFFHEDCLGMVLPAYVADLYTCLSRRDRPFPVADTARIMRGVLEGLCYLHAKQIMHRDIKTENILFNDPSDVCIGDFGAALGPVTVAQYYGLAGTVSTNAPELLAHAAYDFKIDIWSAGLVLYELIAYPHALFEDNSHSTVSTSSAETRTCRAQLIEIIQTLEVHPFEFPEEDPAGLLTEFLPYASIVRTPGSRYPCLQGLAVTMDAEHCLHKMLTFDRHTRPTAAELLLHPFLTPTPRGPTAA